MMKICVNQKKKRQKLGNMERTKNKVCKNHVDQEKTAISFKFSRIFKSKGGIERVIPRLCNCQWAEEIAPRLSEYKQCSSAQSATIGIQIQGVNCFYKLLHILAHKITKLYTIQVFSILDIECHNLGFGRLKRGRARLPPLIIMIINGGRSLPLSS